MNKTVNINIGGLFFHIDEDAYQKLSKYFDSIKRSLTNTSGKDEIMRDIEMRVAELLNERQKSDKHVINNKDVDEVIVIMGQPEDYRIDDDNEPLSESFSSSTRRKKLYRDKDRGLLGGVCTGLSHYFGIEAVWIKILFLLLTFFGGSGILIYFIFWIATPKAVTTSEKLEMTGEPVTISSIEKKVKEEFENVSNSIKNADYDKMGNQVKTGATTVASGISDVLVKIFGALAKVLGVIILVFSSLTLLGLFIGLFTFSSTSFIDTPWQRHIDAVNYIDIPLWAFGIITFLAIGIPLFFFLILGLKLLVDKLKSIGAIAKYSLLAIWIFSVGTLIVLGIKQSVEHAYEGKTVEKEGINLTANDTLKIKFINNEFFKKDIDSEEDFLFTQDSLKNEVIYSNNVQFEIKSTDKLQPYIQIEKLAEGKSFKEANNRAEKIRYGVKISGNTVFFDNYFLTEMASKYRNQKVALYLYIPKGVLFQIGGPSARMMDVSDNDFFNLHFSSDKFTYKMEDEKVKCIDCPTEENEFNDVKIEGEFKEENADTVKSVSIKINGKEVINNELSTKKSKITVGPEGTIIKTK
jgi:phage shock protein PspC (stress-responsive transcriptional regulator)